jgi:tRNA (cmo5U34)-methyltransferase
LETRAQSWISLWCRMDIPLAVAGLDDQRSVDIRVSIAENRRHIHKHDLRDLVRSILRRNRHRRAEMPCCEYLGNGFRSDGGYLLAGSFAQAIILQVLLFENRSIAVALRRNLEPPLRFFPGKMNPFGPSPMNPWKTRRPGPWFAFAARALYKRRMNESRQVWKTEALGKRYLEGVRGAIPLAEQQIELILFLAQQALPQVHRLLDLGCGDGILGSALMSQYPNAHGVFLDFSDTMIQAARAKVLPMTRQATFITQDYGTPEWVNAVNPHGPFDIIVSGFSIHHQPDARKRALYEELFILLAPGGLLLNLEHVASASPWLQTVFDQHFVEALWRFHERSGTTKTKDQIAQEYYHRPDKGVNMLALVEEQCRWLQEIGFLHVDCYFKILELALFGGIKPPLATLDTCTNQTEVSKGNI